MNRQLLSIRTVEQIRGDKQAAERKQAEQNPRYSLTFIRLTGRGGYGYFSNLCLRYISLKFVGVLHVWTPTSLIKERMALLERMVLAPNQSLNSIN